MIPADLPLLPSRAEDAHKGHFGRIVIVGGSWGMHGAPVLAAKAAFSSGAGLVGIAVPESIYAVAGGAELRATWTPCPTSAPRSGLDHESEPALASAGDWADVIGLGPGLGTAAATREVCRRLVLDLDRPIVLDADGLNHWADEPDLLSARSAPTILTPHPGELRRLTGATPGSDPEARAAAARELAQKTRSTVVLKGPGTVVTDGTQLAINSTGNPGMATGGSGDVLTGVIAALLAVLPEPFQAARLGAYLHGAAGDRAAATLGVTAVTATDLIDFLPEAIRCCSSPS